MDEGQFRLCIRIGGTLRHKYVATVVFAALMIFAMGAQADTIWDEGTDGPLSSNPASPTTVTLVSPSDQVLGLGPLGLHIFQFTVPVGNSVDSMIIDPGSGAMTVELVSASINCPPLPASAAPGEILNGSSCAPALPPGDYTFLVDVLTSSAWAVTIASDVPVELLTFTVN